MTPLDPTQGPIHGNFTSFVMPPAMEGVPVVLSYCDLLLALNKGKQSPGFWMPKEPEQRKESVNQFWANYLKESFRCN